MTHIVTRLCLRDTACVEVCPVECMILGKPEEEWPWLYIDPDTCIDCGACVPECPFEAIFPEEEVEGFPFWWLLGMIKHQALEGNSRHSITIAKLRGSPSHLPNTS